MSMDALVPETKVLAIASHVVYGHVGNTMAAFVMQALGCEVAALNTVQYSNHTAYKQWKGTKTTAEEILEIYNGLKQNYLTDFGVLLSGYAPSAEAVQAIGHIARDLKLQASTKPGTFFWVLDPVMGDNGQIYVSSDVVPVYKNLLRDADLILPNQFEAELLSDTKITSIPTLVDAISALHEIHNIAHVIVTSVRFSPSFPTISIVGSTARSDRSARLFKIDIPAIDCFFSGTGDMFAALTVVRLREAVTGAGLSKVKSWTSPDEVAATELPLCKAAEMVLGSMQGVLQKTKEVTDRAVEGMGGMEAGSEKRMHLRRTKAAEVRVVRCLEELRRPCHVYRARALKEGGEEGKDASGGMNPQFRG